MAILAGLALAVSPAQAQDLLIVGRNKNLERIDLSDMSRTITPIGGLAATDSIYGGEYVWINLNQKAYRVLAAEDEWGTNARSFRLDFDTAQASQPTCALNGGNAFASSELTQFQGLDTMPIGPLLPRVVAIDANGSLYTRSCTSPAVIFTLPTTLPGTSTPFPGKVVGSAIKHPYLYLLKEGTGSALGQRVLYEIHDEGPLVGSTISITRSWPVSVTGSQVLGITLSASGHIYALVNRPISCFGHGTGEIIFTRATSDLTSSALTLVQQGNPISSWFNGGVGCFVFDPAYLFFENVPPADVVLTGPTATSGCASITLSASWGSGPETGTIQPGNLTITNGGSVQVVPPAGVTTQYTLTVQGLSGQNATDALTVTSTVASFASEPTGSGATECPGSTQSFTATVQNATGPVDYRWYRSDFSQELFTDLNSGASSTWSIASLNASHAGDYLVRTIDACGTTIDSAPFTIDVGEFASIDAEPASPISVCAGQSWTLDFQVSGDPEPSYELHRQILFGTEVVASGSAVGGAISIRLPALAASEFYQLRISNPCSATPISGTALEVILLTPPTLVATPQPTLTICEGDPIALTASATGDAPLTYAWTKNGAPFSSGPSLSIPVGSVADSGTYRVTVTNPVSTTCGEAFAETVVTVAGAPQLVQADLGASTNDVHVTWDAVGGAAAYRLYRADGPGGLGKQVLVDWTPALEHYDTQAIPGHSYYYSVETALDAAGLGACSESSEVEGWRALTPPVLSMGHTFPQSYVLATWDSPAGSGSYRLYRQEQGDPSTEVVIADWVPGTSFPATGSAFVTYEFWVRAAVDSAGLHESSDSNVVVQTMPCEAPGQECGAPAAPGLLVLIDRSMHMNMPSTFGTRWNDAMLYAQGEVAAFFSQCPAGSVAIWTYAGSCAEDLTTGFVGQTEAETVLASLPAAPSASLGAPLAGSMCEAIFSLCACVDTTGSTCSIPTANGPKEKILLVLGSGTNDFVAMNFCDGVDATSGSNCSSDPFLPSSSWERKVCNVLSGICPTVYALIWDVPFPLPGGSGAMAAFAAATGGAAVTVHDGDPLPEPFFGDCNGNGVADVLDIAGGASADCNQDGVPDECQDHLDCNANGIPDSCDIVAATSKDLNGNGRADECEGFALTASAFPLAGVVNELHVVGGSPFGLVGVGASFPSGTPMPGGPAPSGPQTGAVRGNPVSGSARWEFVVLDADGHGRFQFDVPAELSGQTLAFTAVEISPLQAQSPVLAVTFN